MPLLDVDTITTVDHHTLIGCSQAIVDLARSAFGPLPTHTTVQTLGFAEPAFIAELYCNGLFAYFSDSG